LEFDTNEFINKAAERIGHTDKIGKIKSPIISISKREVKITESGINADKEVMVDSYQIGTINACPDIVSFLQKETELTRHTLVQILKQLDLTKFFINPHAFMSSVKEEILFVLQELMIKGIKYEKTNDYWDMCRFEEEDGMVLVNYLNNLYEVQNKEKSLFDPVEIDSEVEEEFVKDLDNYENIKLFVKLPRWFQIDTPIGRYNPDWAFVTYEDEKVYFVVETKGSTKELNFRGYETAKIECAKRHFKTIGVKYGVDTTVVGQFEKNSSGNLIL